MKLRRPFMIPILQRLVPILGAKLLLEPEFGYVGLVQFKNGNRSYFWDNKFNLNPISSVRIAQDKGYSLFFLKKLGYSVPKSEVFFRESFRRRVKSPRDIGSARLFAQKVGWPVYVKPLRRSQGEGVTLVTSDREFDVTLRRLLAKERALLIQEAVAGRDFRIVVLDGEVLSAYERIPLTVVGDGKSSIGQLLARLQKTFDAQGRDTKIPVHDPRIGDALRRARRRVSSVLPEGFPLRLLDVANLSLGGTTLDLTSQLHVSFAKLASSVADDLDLRLAGVDVIAADATQAIGEYAILEINSAPGLDHYGTYGAAQERHVDELYLKLLRAVERGPRLTRRDSRESE